MRKSILLLVLIIALSGCVLQDEVEKSVVRDVISIPEKISTPQGDVPAYVVSPANPYSGTTAKLSFFVVNQGEEKIDEVEVDFFDVLGLELTLSCQSPSEYTESTDESTGDICILNEVERGEYRKIIADFPAPLLDIDEPRPYEISFSVNYIYKGSRLASIPIVDGETVMKPTNTYEPSNPSDGPIELEFELEIKEEEEVGGRKVKKYWVEKGDPFLVTMVLKIVGSKSLGEIRPVKIKSGDLVVALENLKVKEGFNCFTEKIEDVENKVVLTSDEDIEIETSKPAELLCYFESSKDFQGWITSTIEASFTYNYKFIKTQLFTVRPLP